jgi:regulator of replication initiation timing
MLRLFLLISGIVFANGSSFEERLKILEIIVHKQQAEMDLLKQANIELKQENLQLNYDNTKLKSRVNELELDVSRLKDEGMHNNPSYESHINAAMHDNVDSIHKSSVSDWHGTPNVQNDQHAGTIANLSKSKLCFLHVIHVQIVNNVNIHASAYLRRDDNILIGTYFIRRCVEPISLSDCSFASNGRSFLARTRSFFD